MNDDIVLEAAGRKMPGYDKKGDKHYDTISAFIKSMRGSDVDATLYYLARMVQAGEDPKFIARRMVIFASEDIGLAGNGALSLATACFQAVERVGMPESGLMLAHTAVALAKSKKSRATTDAWYKALDLARKAPNESVPVWLRNAPTKLMKDLGYGKGQKWEAGFHDFIWTRIICRIALRTKKFLANRRVLSPYPTCGRVRPAHRHGRTALILALPRSEMPRKVLF